MRLQELAEKYGEQVWLLQNIARTAVRDVDPQVCITTLLLCFALTSQKNQKERQGEGRWRGRGGREGGME
jgi:hypothetical protein